MLELYKNIKKYRLLNKMSQEDLAKRMGYSDKSMISKIENNKVDLSLSNIIAFAQIFDVDAQDLMGFINESGEEKMLIDSYRNADEMSKSMVKRILSYKEGENNENK